MMVKVVVMVVMVVLATAITEVSAQRSGQRCTDSDGRGGVCGPIRNCPSLVSLLGAIRQGTAPEGSLNRLKQSICSFSGNIPLICCASTSVSLPAPRPPVRTTPGPNPVPAPVSTASPSRGSVLPETCGTGFLEDRIIDGVDAPLQSWYWMVALHGTVNGRQTWFCGGTLINEEYVLTAAHCINAQVHLDFARIGEHTFSSIKDCANGRCKPEPQDITVARIIVHPEYNRPCPQCNDIALLKLSRPAILHSGWVVPICLPLDPLKDMGFTVDEFQGKVAKAAGWGSTDRDFRVVKTPDVLQQVGIPIQELNYCRQLRQAYPDPRMALCAGGDGRDTCRGDSGGPLTLEDKFGLKTFLVGVTSLGPRSCGTTSTQALYSSVHHYIPWILNVLQST